MAGPGVNGNPHFPGWEGNYRDDKGYRVTLGIRILDGDIIVGTATGERLRFTPLEAGLLLDGLAAAIRAVGSVP